MQSDLSNIESLSNSDSAQQELQTLKGICASQEAEMLNLKQREKVLYDSLQAAQEQIATLEADLQAKVDKISEGDVNASGQDADDTKKFQDLKTQEIENRDAIIKDLQQQLESISQAANSGSVQVLEKLRSDLQASQKQVQRLQEEHQLSRSAVEEARKVLIECGQLRAALKENDDLLKEAQSLVIDQESTISLLQSNMNEAETRSEAKLREYQDQISLLKVVIEDLKSQCQQIHHKKMEEVSDCPCFVLILLLTFVCKRAWTALSARWIPLM